ncbi:hypothetical protein [Methanothrix sp.]|uniref:hypothetical protein n=1 Tax=Methanothrix sp. TaxID=90426 RepID=UPI003BB022CD
MEERINGIALDDRVKVCLESTPEGDKPLVSRTAIGTGDALTTRGGRKGATVSSEPRCQEGILPDQIPVDRINQHLLNLSRGFLH